MKSLSKNDQYSIVYRHLNLGWINFINFKLKYWGKNDQSQTHQELKKFIGNYKGSGINHEGQPFVGELKLSEVAGGKGYLLNFKAIEEDGSIYHEESSTIAPSIEEKLCLYNINTNVPGLLCHQLHSLKKVEDIISAEFSFGNIENKEEFREVITLTLYNNGDVSYAYSWGMPTRKMSFYDK